MQNRICRGRKKIHDLVGGRIVELKATADKSLAEQSFEGFIILQQMNLHDSALD